MHGWYYDFIICLSHLFTHILGVCFVASGRLHVYSIMPIRRPTGFAPYSAQPPTRPLVVPIPAAWTVILQPYVNSTGHAMDSPAVAAKYHQLRGSDTALLRYLMKIHADHDVEESRVAYRAIAMGLENLRSPTTLSPDDAARQALVEGLLAASTNEDEEPPRIRIGQTWRVVLQPMVDRGIELNWLRSDFESHPLSFLRYLGMLAAEWIQVYVRREVATQHSALRVLAALVAGVELWKSEFEDANYTEDEQDAIQRTFESIGRALDDIDLSDAMSRM